MAIITSHDNTKVNSLPPPISSPHRVKIVGLNLPYIFLSFPGVTPTVIQPFLAASIAAFV